MLESEQNPQKLQYKVHSKQGKQKKKALIARKSNIILI